MEGNTTTPRPASKKDNDVTSVSSYGESDDDSDYVESRKKFPSSSVNTPEIAGHIRKLEKIHKVTTFEIREFYQTMEIFNCLDKVNFMEIANDENTPD